MPLPIVVAIIEKNGKQLLIRRENETYNGQLALVGGKIEDEEHPMDAVKREVKEETGLDVFITDFHGLVSEHLHSGEELENQFLIHVFEVELDELGISESDEGSVGWFEVEEVSDEIIPSDLKMLNKAREQDKTYFECQIEDDELLFFH